MKMKANDLQIILGSICMSFLMYHRFLRVRLPQELIPLPSEKLLFVCTILLSTITLLCYSIYVLYRIHYPKKKTHWFTLFLVQIANSSYNPVNIIHNSMVELDYYIKDKLPMYDHRLSYSMFLTKSLALWFTKHFTLGLIIIFSLRIIPQIAITSIFLYEVFIVHYLNYCYKMLILLAFPLLVHYILYSVKVFVQNNLENLNELVQTYIIDKNLYDPENNFANAVKIDIFLWHQLRLSGESRNYICVEILTTDIKYTFPVDTQSRREILLLCRRDKDDFLEASDTLESYAKYKVIIESLVTIIRYSLHLLAWSYILMSNFAT